VITAVAAPDLSSRPFILTVERIMVASPALLFLAWTEQFDRWFAAPGSVLMKRRDQFSLLLRNAVRRKPPSSLWTLPQARRRSPRGNDLGHGCNQRFETVVSVELAAHDRGTRLRLTHVGFADEESCTRHKEAWPKVLAHLDKGQY
jgi:uncharacterized protein YndB with AHSA1/START domain